LKFNINETISKTLTGKTLISLEYGFKITEEAAKEEGERFAPLPAKIIKAWMGTTESDRDPCIWVRLDKEDENGDRIEIYFYDNETVTVEG